MLSLPSFKTAPAQHLIGLTLNATAAWYLASYLTMAGTVSTLPLVIVALIALVPFGSKRYRNQFRPPSPHEQLWILSLGTLGVWGAIAVWYHEGDSYYFETPVKLILGSIVATTLALYRVKLSWIKAGAIIGSLLLMLLILQQYEGQHRFSPLMNATKWGNAIAFQTILCISLMLVSTNNLNRTLFLTLASFGLFATLITGTRGALAPLLALGAALPIIYWRTLSWQKLALSGCVLATALFIAAQHPTLDARIKQTQNSFIELSKDNWQTSIGIRLAMWRAGISAAIEEPGTGAGYNFEEIFENYQAPSSGLARATSMIKANFENFHSIYVDTLVRTGVIGLALLLILFGSGLWNGTREKRLLMLAPVLGFAVSGLFDSALELGITTSYLIIAGSILKAVEIQD